MATIDINVDTSPMAKSIDSVSKHVDGTSAAVVGMQMAVIKAESDAADHVCDNVNKGFYAMLRSQISQKLAKLQSEVDSLLYQLNQQTRQLQAIQARMGRDYNMITRRYLKIFDSINRSLTQRVQELDRPVFDFANRDMEQVTNRTLLLTATAPIAQDESVRQSQRILMSNIKYRGMNVLRSINCFLDESLDLDKITGLILLPQRVNESEREYYAPVIVSESVIDSNSNKGVNIYVSQDVGGQHARSDIHGVVARGFESMEWGEPVKADDHMRGEFASLVNADGSMSQRVKDEAMRLFNEAEFRTTVKTGQS